MKTKVGRMLGVVWLSLACLGWLLSPLSAQELVAMASGMLSTVFVFVWVGAFGSFAALLLNPNLFPNRHGIAFILAAVIVTEWPELRGLASVEPVLVIEPRCCLLPLELSDGTAPT